MESSWLGLIVAKTIDISKHYGIKNMNLKKDYLETAKLDKLISKLKEKEYGDYVLNLENGKRLL